MRHWMYILLFNRTMEYSGSAGTAALETSMLHCDRQITVLGIQKNRERHLHERGHSDRMYIYIVLYTLYDRFNLKICLNRFLFFNEAEWIG